MSSILKYGAFTNNAIKQKYAYRFKAVMWSLSTLFNMLVQYFLWKTVFEDSGSSFMGVTKGEYLIYICFGVVFYNLTSCMENMTIAEEIKTGNIAMNLTKPVNYKKLVLFRHFGNKIGELIGLIPLIFVACLLSGSNVKIDVNMICFFISAIFAFYLIFLFAYIIGLFTFWTTNYWGLQFFVNALMGLFSGQLVSISFYLGIGRGDYNSTIRFLNNPIFMGAFKSLGKVAYALPFQSMYYTPMSILSGINGDLKVVIIHMLIQVFWVVILSLLAKLIWIKAQKKISILGG